jgi:hypothetical protein
MIDKCGTKIADESMNESIVYGQDQEETRFDQVNESIDNDELKDPSEEEDSVSIDLESCNYEILDPNDYRVGESKYFSLKIKF